MNDFKKLLDVSHAPTIPAPKHGQSVRKAEFTKTSGSIEVPENVAEGDAEEFLLASGQNPADWEVTGFRRSEWGDPEDPFVSTRFTFSRRKHDNEEVTVDLDPILTQALGHPLSPDASRVATSPAGAAVLIGDMQYGKGDDPEEALRNAFTAIDRAAERISAEGGVDQLLIAWLGDHVEGFVSQGGANVWRTKLTLTEQIRATRRTMLYALEKFENLADAIIMAAVPGNHGEALRVNGKGTTRYDDNFDVEALNAVAETVVEVNRATGRWCHVECFVPEKDGISLSVEVGGITWGLVHGDRYRPGKHFDWWQGQVFGGRPVAAADVLVAGHYHHLLVEEQGAKLFIQVPALETESKWYEHIAGTKGNPGIVIAYTDGKDVTRVEPVRASV